MMHEPLADNVIRYSQFDTINVILTAFLVNKKNIRICPVCMVHLEVRVSGKQGDDYQYFCKDCKTYFIPKTLNNPQKKIWHDRIRYKRLRRIEKLAR